MRPSLPLLARYLKPGTPTGLTGLLTHSAPRPALLTLYRTTLDKLGNLPESSLYRQSTEALTRQRLSFVERAVPPGYEEWEAKARKILADNPDKFALAGDELSSPGMRTVHIEGKTYLTPEKRPQRDVRTEEWNGEGDQGAVPEGQRLGLEKEDMIRAEQAKAQEKTPVVGLENEPNLTADQVAQLENSIGAGLIEEVIQVAEGELKLVGIMHQERSWEPLEEKPSEGQWTYFDRTA